MYDFIIQHHNFYDIAITSTQPKHKITLLFVFTPHRMLYAQLQLVGDEEEGAS